MERYSECALVYVHRRRRAERSFNPSLTSYRVSSRLLKMLLQKKPAQMQLHTGNISQIRGTKNGKGQQEFFFSFFFLLLRLASNTE